MAKKPELFCSSCIFFSGSACAAGKVADGEDITTVSDCTHRTLPPTPSDTAGDDPATKE